FIMNVVAGTKTGTTYITDNLSAFYFFPNRYGYSAHVAVKCFITKAMIYYDVVTVTLFQVVCFFHNTNACSINRGAFCSSKVNSGMELIILVYRVYSPSKTGDYAFEGFIIYGLNCRYAR